MRPRLPALAALGCLTVAALALPSAPRAETPAAPAAKKKEAGSGFGAFGSGGGKEPIKIDADRLDVFDRENKAIFAGNVVAVQGESTIRCSSMTVHYQRKEKEPKGKAAEAKPEAKPDAKASIAQPAEAKPVDGKPVEKAVKVEAKPEPKVEKAEKSADPTDGSAIRQVVCAGPVTVVSKDQVASGDNAVFDRVANRVVLTGNVVLSQCQNVTRGSRLVYDMNTGRANMDPVAGGRVSAMFVPGGKDDGAKGKQAGCAQPPGQAGKAAPKPRG
ncbi:LptA/OstA family protein [Methylobacterium platani]|uniref:Organic solvent tolerance protein OstA n=2 Tax=Methylobacterium platani TaxID=427683 RepID=A0A179RZZ1_9HYPH|nr:LptA/OstA family protein [Methylobacterium platani]KMO22176.1 organic solvent tolerance protein OstA [Methylobacterium platani JCM 14648]OAS17286.1 organic solvent tolerance protein OstA [Methylobacterium platani]